MLGVPVAVHCGRNMRWKNPRHFISFTITDTGKLISHIPLRRSTPICGYLPAGPKVSGPLHIIIVHPFFVLYHTPPCLVSLVSVIPSLTISSTSPDIQLQVELQS
jgi:hypothetical protein